MAMCNTLLIDYIEDLLNLIYVYQQEYREPTEALTETIEEIDLYFLIDDLQKILNSMKYGAERIKDIILDLRNFSRLDEADLKSVDLLEGLENTLKILQYRFKPQANRPEIQLVKDYQKLPLVECYAAQINQVFMNIVNNAIDALEMVAQPMIKIQTSLSDDFKQVQLAICDNGCGISDAIIRKIFDPFFTTKPVGKGTGMGLAVSYQIIVYQHGGHLECVSKPGQGSEFLITLPIRHQQGISDRISDQV
jgi:signal transduction histidine kinase